MFITAEEWLIKDTLLRQSNMYYSITKQNEHMLLLCI